MPPSLTRTEREAILERKIKEYTDHGWILKKSTEVDATLVPPGRKGNAVADGVLTVAWFGLWLIPAIIGKDRYKKVTIHVYTDGSVRTQGPKPAT